ncbi:MAG: PilN domain-containing protein, partial [Thermoleophilia bacterium]|nr:PilN domain-containing protein [Thermoleophilia bacterium]
DVSLVLPANVSLTRLAAQLPAASAAGVAATTTSVDAGLPSAPTGVEVEGYTDSQPSVARLLARLRSLPSLSNVQLQSSTQEEVGQKQVVRFVVLADMAGGAS